MPIAYTPQRKTPVKGRKFALSRKNEVLSNDITVTSPAVDATITVGAEASDARDISVQLKDANGNNIDFVECVDLILFLDAGGEAFVVTGGSTGIAIDANGAILAVVAKKLFKAVTDATGLLTLTWTDTGTEAAYLGVRLPSGRIVMSSALTNA